MPDGVTEGIVKGLYKLSMVDVDKKQPRVQLFGSGTILREALRAQEILAGKHKVSSNVWSVTSYTELRRDIHAVSRWNLLHPNEKPRRSYLEETLAKEEGPFIASSDYVRAVPEQIAPWVPGGLFALGTDGLGRSDTRERLRRHFEVDAEFITLAALTKLAEQGKFDRAKLPKVITNLGLDPEKVDPLFA
jgi:pyruvate dehydrogenase E1 component